MRYHRSLIIVIVCLSIIALSVPVFAERTGGRVRIGGDLHIPAEDTVHGDTVTVLGKQVIEGNVEGAVVSIFGDVEISGEVSEDVIAVFGDVILKEGAEVDGDLVNVLGKTRREGVIRIGGEEITMDAGEIGMRIRENIHLDSIRLDRFFNFFHWPLWGFLLSVIWTLAIVTFFPKQIRNISDAIEHDGLRVGVKGLLGVIVIVIAVVLLAITILGIPVAVLLGLAVWLAVIFGSVAVYYLVGERLAEQFNWETSDVVKALLGTVLLSLVTMVPFGEIVELFVGLLALGGIIVTKFGSEQPWIE